MRKINISPGIKTSLEKIFNKSQDIFFENYGEMISKIFSPGFFIKKLADNQLADDFKPQIILDNSEGDLLKINIAGRKPASAITNAGKIINLNDTIKISPQDINGYSYYNPSGTVQNITTTYDLFIIPIEVDSEETDYLPGYKIDGQTKPFIKSYVVNLLLVKKGLAPPPINTIENDSQLTITLTSRIPASIEGIKLAEFSYNPATRIITNLIDKRAENRAYLYTDLYDFFKEAYLKHDYILINGEDSAGGNNLTFGKNGNNHPTLTGTLTLISIKERVINNNVVFPSRIVVPLNNIPIPVNSVLAITVTGSDYNAASNLSKTLEVIPINNYTPDADKIILGYHVRTFLSNGTPDIDQTGNIDAINDLGEGSNVSDVNNEQSCIYFVNGLPPLMPGQYISRNGIPSYNLTKDEARATYFSKSQSLSKFLKSGNDSSSINLESFKNNLIQDVKSEHGDFAYIGHRYDGDIPVGQNAGYIWLNKSDDPIGYVIRQASNSTTGFLEIGLFKNDGTNLYALRLENGFLKVIGSNDYPGNTNGDYNKLLTVAHGLLNKGDEARGVYDFKVGKMIFYRPTDQYNNIEHADIDADGLIRGTTVSIVAEFKFDDISDVFADFHDHILTGLKNPRSGTDGEKDAVPRKWHDDELNSLFIKIINDYSQYNAIVKNNPTNNGYEFATIREAIETQKTRILIKPGTYVLSTIDNFWPTENTNVPINGIIIDGGNQAIINGNTLFVSNNNLENITFKGITFQGETNNQFEDLFKIGNNLKWASNISLIECSFLGVNGWSTESTGTIGVNVASIKNSKYGSLTIDKCLFKSNLIGIGTNSMDTPFPDSAFSTSIFRIKNSFFEDNVVSIAPLYNKNYLIESNIFRILSNKHSYIGIAANELVTYDPFASTYKIATAGYFYYPDFRKSNKIIIRNNHFYNVTNLFHLSDGAISINADYYSRAGNIYIEGNHFNGGINNHSITVKTVGISPPDETHDNSGDAFKITLLGNYFTDFGYTAIPPKSPNSAGFHDLISLGTNHRNWYYWFCLSKLTGGGNYYDELTNGEIGLSNFII